MSEIKVETNAMLGDMQIVYAITAMLKIEHEKAQHWFAERAPAAGIFQDPILHFWSPFGDPTNLSGRDRDFTELLGLPVFDAALARKDAIDRATIEALERGERVVTYCAKRLPGQDLVIDWLNAMAENNRVLMLVLPALSWATVAGIAREWDRQSNQGLAEL